MKIIHETEHRPYPLSSGKWIMRQAWRHILFIHLPISPERIRNYIHPSLQLDTFDELAWISIVIFKMEGIYPRGFPFISITSPFPEINVRTYVKWKGKPGVHFLSLDVGDWASFTLAKKWYHLPYHSANISLKQRKNTFYFESLRRKSELNPILCNGIYTPNVNTFTPGKETLEHWLTERYCFYSTDHRGHIYAGEIHHPPWALQEAKIEIFENTMLAPYNIEISEQPIVHFSEGIDSLFWNIKKI
ncbi:YqjF family protein [Bacillus sp. S/N-304-OC-R1]|uniref:YqjF family protein n=1 Tax=Bacillus sp. S/N-304-OC-R1 TaxID=2758034 RepID=UPI001C8D0237|nr:DUF2071 domain-containing protein [Bacillus sp. S/N-304-OC-R1]MBY0120970.1 DUF2071 domain-containing protein [Bacillus sp. S/N-304-OC-R1]